MFEKLVRHCPSGFWMMLVPVCTFEHNPLTVDFDKAIPNLDLPKAYSLADVLAVIHGDDKMVQRWCL